MDSTAWFIIFGIAIIAAIIVVALREKFWRRPPGVRMDKINASTDDLHQYSEAVGASFQRFRDSGDPLRAFALAITGQDTLKPAAKPRRPSKAPRVRPRPKSVRQ